MMKNTRISVRTLVEFILRAGDIDNRTEAGPDPAAMLEGSRIHRKIQKAQPEGYEAEVTLKEVFEKGDLKLLVWGRADGILKTGEGVTVDEIKGVYADVRRFTEPKPLHLAQAKCYAAMLSEAEELPSVTCQVTYANLETEEIRRFRETFTREELRGFMEALTGAYFRWAEFEAVHDEARDRSASELSFPYKYRAGQKETAVSVFRAIRRGRNLFVQAPTGVGKTLSTVYPSVKALAEGAAGRIFYLTAKTVTRTVAEDTFRLLAERGLDLLSCTVTAKEKACLNDVFDCNPENCPYAKGHFDRVNEAVYDCITHERAVTRETVEHYARKHRVCPYELSLDVGTWCDAVIADYNYAFDPRVRLRRFFSEGSEGNYILLVDEAHNLVQRASEMFSAELVKEEVLEAKRLLKDQGKSLTGALDRLSRAMLVLRRTMELYPDAGGRTDGGKAVVLPDVSAFLPQLETAFREMSTLLEEKKNFPERKDALAFYFKLRTFLSVAESMGDDYRIYARYASDGSFKVRLLCVDPSARLKEGLSFARSAVFFSATLLPVNYYKELLTGNLEEYAVYAGSPFGREQRLLLAARDVSSRYTRRNDQEFSRIASYIETCARVRPGNYLCFFPSYRYLSEIAARLGFPPERVMVQRPEMTEEDRDAFLSFFRTADGTDRIGLCVMGGIFAEGIDLKEESLIGTIIVGTGLPAINTESEIVKSCFDARGKKGFDYAYRFPGMNKVLQAAGRLIRSDKDRGIILLLDDRFLGNEYRGLFPAEWSDLAVTDAGHVEDQLRAFWK